MAAPFDPNKVSIFAKTNFRGEARPIGIKAIDRLRHMYIIGKSGVGKSTLIDNLAAQDVLAGDGLALLDPHGSSAEKILKYVPENRIQDVVYFNPDDVNHPLAFNLIEDVHPDKRSKVANGLLSMLKKIWPDSFSARMEYLTMNMLLLLLENPGSTILGINRAFADKTFLDTLTANIKSPSLRSVWMDEILKYDERFYREATAPIQNKVGQFISDPIIRNIVGQPKSSFDFADIMNSQKIFVANLSKGKIDEQNARLLGGMIVTKIYLAAMGRADIPEEEQEKLPPFYMYVDEFQNFASESYADILSEARKYKLGLTMAHQYVAQLPDPVRDAVFGNVGTMVAFLTGNLDAELFEKEFSPTFTKEDFTSLGFAQIYLKLLIDGIASAPFSGQTIAPWPYPEQSFVPQVIESSRRLYGRNREELEQEIADWFKPLPNKKDAEHERYIIERRLEIEQRGGVWRDKETGNALPNLTNEEIDAYEQRLTDVLGESVKFNRKESEPKTKPDTAGISIAHHLVPKKTVPVVGVEELPAPEEKPKEHKKQQDEKPGRERHEKKKPKKEKQKPRRPEVEKRSERKLADEIPDVKDEVVVSGDLQDLLQSLDTKGEKNIKTSEKSFSIEDALVTPQKQEKRADMNSRAIESPANLNDILHEPDKKDDEVDLSDLISKSIIRDTNRGVKQHHTRQADKDDKESLTETLKRLGLNGEKSEPDDVVQQKEQSQNIPIEKPKDSGVAQKQDKEDGAPRKKDEPEVKKGGDFQKVTHQAAESFVSPASPTPRYIPDDLLRQMLEE